TYIYTGQIPSPATSALILQLVGVGVTFAGSFIAMVLNVIKLGLTRDALDSHLRSIQGQLRLTQTERDKLRNDAERHSREWQLLHIMSPSTDLRHPLMAAIVAEVEQAPVQEYEY